MDFFKEIKINKSRKEHKCLICGETINEGEECYRCSGKYLNEFFSDYFHSECLKMRNYYLEESGEQEYTSDSVLDAITNDVCYDCEEFNECNLSYRACKKVLEKINFKEETVFIKAGGKK